MLKVKARIFDGLIESERIAIIDRADGSKEEVVLPKTQVFDDSVLSWLIEENQDRLLIELPRESSAGNWRIWINSSAVSTT